MAKTIIVSDVAISSVLQITHGKKRNFKTDVLLHNNVLINICL